MQNMVVLIDTNILLNYLTNRSDAYLEQSIKIPRNCLHASGVIIME